MEIYTGSIVIACNCTLCHLKLLNYFTLFHKHFQLCLTVGRSFDKKEISNRSVLFIYWFYLYALSHKNWCNCTWDLNNSAFSDCFFSSSYVPFPDSDACFQSAVPLMSLNKDNENKFISFTFVEMCPFNIRSYTGFLS